MGGFQLNEFIELIEQENIGKVRLNEPLKKHTSWKIGGPADIMIQPDHKEGLVMTLRSIQKYRLPYIIIGRGSNLLVRDGGFRGVVVKLGSGLDHLSVQDEFVTAGAGYSLIKLANVIAKQGLSGLEFAGGIPGTVGGAVYMNAGAHGSDISHILYSAEVLFDDGELTVLKNEELRFSYRHSILQKTRKGVCLEATFRLQKKDKEAIKAEMLKHKKYRQQTQPLQDANACCGSVFRNPKPHSAGALIEQAGLKGYRIGDAQVSPLHANFIVNLGQATAKDVLALIDHIQKTIAEKFDVHMRPEVQVVGED